MLISNTVDPCTGNNIASETLMGLAGAGVVLSAGIVKYGTVHGVVRRYQYVAELWTCNQVCWGTVERNYFGHVCRYLLFSLRLVGLFVVVIGHSMTLCPV